MLTSVWLTKLIVSMLNRSDSVLKSYYQHLTAPFCASKTLLCLFEADRESGPCILITNDNACELPVPDSKTDVKEMLPLVEDRQIKRLDNRCLLPLSSENTSVFGLMILENCKMREAPGPAENAALRAFSLILYSEAMGGIIKPHHETVLSARGLCVDYQVGQKLSRVVKNINLDICEKEFTVMLGASGCGKTSFLNAIGGMLVPSAGSILWKGKDITGANDKELTQYRKDKIGFIFQHYNLIADLTAKENVEIAAAIAENPLSADEVLETVGLQNKKNSYPSQMSGGEQQRVCIARALVKQSEILLCDEPTGALDTENAKQIICILQDLAVNKGIPIMMITHNPAFTVLAGHCVTMSNGTIVEEIYQPFPLDARNIVLQ